MRDRSSDDWVKAIQERDSQAVAELLRLMVSVAFSHLKVQSDLDLDMKERVEIAHDCAQESILSIIENIDSYDESKGLFRRWAIRIALNEARQWMRAWRRERKAIIRYGKERLIAEHSKTIEDIIERKELVEFVVQLIDNYLNEKEREVIEQCYVQGRAFKEIAEVLETTESYAFRIHYRAKRKLRPRLQDWFCITEQDS